MSIIDKEKASTSFNVINSTKSLEDAERRYVELYENEKQRMRKKEQESKEIINKINKKLKVGNSLILLTQSVWPRVYERLTYQMLSLAV